MQIDARNLANNQTISTDICIIGAGPAGTTLAREFLETKTKISILESGGLSSDRKVQSLSEGSLSGEIYEPLEETHLRQLGGTANHWIIKMSDGQFGYRFTPLYEIDFEKRNDYPHSGWPITKKELDPYYARAHEVCEVGACDYSANYWTRTQGNPLDLPSQLVVNNVYMFAPTGKFIREFPSLVANSTNVDTYINATVVELISSKDGKRIEQALVRMFDGKEIYFKANHFVIAANALQTPRLLLNSKKYHPNGIGNQHDNVGRYYTDHALVPSGNFYPADKSVINKLGFYDMHLIDGASVMGKLSLSPEVIKKEGLRNFTATLFPMPEFKDIHALESCKAIASDLIARKFPTNFGAHLLNLYRSKGHLLRVLYERLRYKTPILPGFGRGGWSRLSNNDKKYQRLELMAIVEQSPNPENRVTLTNEKDVLGCQKIKLHFTWSQTDIDSILRAQTIISEALSNSGLGRYEPSDTTEESIRALWGLHHMAGTTRMSDSPRDGVVDKNCKVHDMENLYIAGSATFPTGGYANPTLTNLALTIRIADVLKQKLET
jgi:choline dehydrogenase-like flavoprotein